MSKIVLSGGQLVDGTGSPPRPADVAISHGRVTDVGPGIDRSGSRVVDIQGLVVCPGFVDLHTHYDSQLLWDPCASPSLLHGVTTVIGGNCGFTIAPMAPEHADYVRSMMASVEGMPLSALESGPEWNWRGFGEYLDMFSGKVSINAGFLVGHSTIRRMVMGESAVAARATTDELRRMAALVARSLEEGALGLSSSRGPHLDGQGAPVPSRAANREELVALAAVVGRYEGTTLEFIPGMGEISEESADLMADMSLAANRPLNWNLLGSLSPTPVYTQQLAASDRARDRGARVVALTLPDVMRMRSDGMLEPLPGWRQLLGQAVSERRALVGDTDFRHLLKQSAATLGERGLGAATDWDLIEITNPGRVRGAEAVVGKTVAEVAAGRGVDALDVVIDDVVCNDLHLTLLFPSLEPTLGRGDKGWAARAAVWRDPRVVLGGSDAGAHLDLMCHANYPTVVLGEAVRDRGLLRLEEAVHLLTQVPAELYGLRGRGTVAEGMQADLVVFDPDLVGSAPLQLRADLPGGGSRLYATATGVRHVYVNGGEVVTDGEHTGKLAGHVLRSGRDTRSVTL